jgi:hypothetical protein
VKTPPDAADMHWPAIEYARQVVPGRTGKQVAILHQHKLLPMALRQLRHGRAELAVRVAGQPVLADRMGRVEDAGENLPLGSNDGPHRMAAYVDSTMRASAKVGLIQLDVALSTRHASAV